MTMTPLKTADECQHNEFLGRLIHSTLSDVRTDSQKSSNVVDKMEDSGNIAFLRNKICQSEASADSSYGRDDEETLANLCSLVKLLENAIEDESTDQVVCLLEEIAEMYKRIALSKLLQHQLVDDVGNLGFDLSVWLEGLSRERLDELDDELAHELAESVLDWAIATKRASNLSECLYANLMRMRICPIYRITDAVRLLGLHKKDGSYTPTIWNNVILDDLPTTGAFFQVERRPWRNASNGNESYHASEAARKAGKMVRNIFREHDYTYRNCRSILVSLLSDGEVENASHPERIFSANVFFRYRLELATDNLQSSNSNSFDGLQVLARLFLFGLAVNRKLVENVLGRDQLGVLEEAGLVTASPACAKDVVGEVQVFPIRQRDLFGISNEYDTENEDTYVFMTDWPLESLRLPRDAIMSVGDDTLELMALSADCTADSGANQRLLDLCCGCGIQGIFAWCCSNPPSSSEGGFNEMVLADVNERALHFVVANLALNGVSDGGYRHQDHSKQVHVLRSDLYEALSFSGKAQEGSPVGATSNFLNGATSLTFDRILSNPPFVAIPLKKLHCNPHTAPALYAVGGGVDGTALLERIVRDSFKFLNTNNPKASVRIVTEVPNVESSCELLGSFMPGNMERESWAVRIAYVGRDVESVQEYSRVRELETSISSDVCRNWELPQLEDGVRNRALVLIGISRQGKSGLFQYGERRDEFAINDATAFEEEDLFLTKQGVEFGRSCLFPAE